MAFPLFRDRIDAGRQLAERLRDVAPGPGKIVLALPRGGVPVGFEVAQALHCDFDVFLVRKLGVPGHEELAMGAIASGGVRVLNLNLIEQLGVSSEAVDRATARELAEIQRREHLYREGRPALLLDHRTVILIDDGLATGATMLAAVHALRARKPKKIIVAVPVAAPDSFDELRQTVDQVLCLNTPEPFHSVGAWYDDFGQVTDAEVSELLQRSAHNPVT